MTDSGWNEIELGVNSGRWTAAYLTFHEDMDPGFSTVGSLARLAVTRMHAEPDCAQYGCNDYGIPRPPWVEVAEDGSVVALEILNQADEPEDTKRDYLVARLFADESPFLDCDDRPPLRDYRTPKLKEIAGLSGSHDNYVVVLAVP